MFPYLRLGPFLLQTPGLALLAGLWLGTQLTEKESTRTGINPDHVNGIIFSGLLAGIVGARLGYALQYFSVYAASPISLFALTANTLNPFAGMFIAVVVGFVYARRKNLPLRPTLDALAPGLAVFLVALGIAHILSGDAFGEPANNLPWSIYLWNDYRHPSQAYETLAALVIFGLTLAYRWGPPGSGLTFLTVIALSLLARIFLETFRGDSLIWRGGFRAAQVISLIVLAITLWTIKSWSQLPAPSIAVQEKPG